MKRWNILVLGVIALLAVSLLIAARKSSSTMSMEKETSASPNVEGKRTPVLVELFTSEGCSSCPPADELLSRLEREQPVAGALIIVLSQHVDYWNSLGWSDPYSSAAFSERQGGYASAFNRDGVYTPQMVVDGQAEFVGSNGDKAGRAIATAAKARKATISLTRGEQRGADSNTIPLNIRIENLPELSIGDTAEMLLAIVEDDLHSSVARGENAGRSLSHVAVVRALNVIGNLNPQDSRTLTTSSNINLDSNWKRGKLRVIVFVQESKSRHVLGAAALSLAAI